jgi:hypothetical protein
LRFKPSRAPARHRAIERPASPGWRYHDSRLKNRLRIDFGRTRCTNADMSEVSTSETPLRASFQVKLNGESLVISTVGQAYRFITRLNTVEWMEFQSLHNDAKAALEAAAGDGMMIVQATNALRALLARAKLL